MATSAKIAKLALTHDIFVVLFIGVPLGALAKKPLVKERTIAHKRFLII